jgi:diadenosine tetraphosphatase ApaH/serine/threonine PP2A family protein phosphatase
VVLPQVFNWLPLAAHVEGKILCMHGGIGRSINRIKQIEVLYRPLTMEQGGVVLMDLLWSDPTTNDAVQVLASHHYSLPRYFVVNLRSNSHLKLRERT